MTDTLSATGVSSVVTMLIVALVALVLGLGALWLARKRSRDHAAGQPGAQPSDRHPRDEPPNAE